MINIFELSAGVARTKQLANRNGRDVSPVHANKPDIKKGLDPIGPYMDEVKITSHANENSPIRKSSGTPMKMLIEEEMLREIESKRREPNIVARLMGLDNIPPAQFSIPTSCKGSTGVSLVHGALPGALAGSHQPKMDGCLNKGMSCSTNHQDNIEFKDIYAIRSPPKTSSMKDQFVPTESGKVGRNEERIALVRRKLMEANHPETAEGVLQMRELEDAIRFLSSNRDFCDKFLQQPNSLFSMLMKDIRGSPPASQATRITVLKPSKTEESEKGRVVRKQQYGVISKIRRETKLRHWGSNLSQSKSEGSLQPTRIVVLEPSTRKSKLLPLNNLAKVKQQSDFSDDSEDSEELASTSRLNKNGHQASHCSNCHQRTESMLSSVCSDGYDIDESSFGSSENDYVGDSVTNLENVLPNFKHPWDFVNNCDGTHSFSPKSRASYSSEASVVMEAKRHLSERWASSADNEDIQEDLHLTRSSRTLGEILGRSVTKKGEFDCDNVPSCPRSFGCPDKVSLLGSSLFPGGTQDVKGETSTSKAYENILRSRSVPVSSKAYENIALKVEDYDHPIRRTNISKEVSNLKKEKSLKGKVSSFFFPKRNRTNSEKLLCPALAGFDGENQSGIVKPAVIKNTQTVNLFSQNFPAEFPSVAESTQARDVSEEGKIFSDKASICNSSDTDLLRPCESSNMDAEEFSSSLFSGAPVDLRNVPHSADTNSKLHFLSRVSPISSVARNLSCDSDKNISVMSKTLNATALPKGDDNEMGPSFMQALLSVIGLENFDTVLDERYYLGSPSDPIVLEKFLDSKKDEKSYVEKRTRRRLQFDTANSTLQETITHAEISAQGTQAEAQKISHYFADKRMFVAGGSDNVGAEVTRALAIGIGGKEWSESMKIEVNEISTEISCHVLKDLVRETLTEFTAACACC